LGAKQTLFSAVLQRVVSDEFVADAFAFTKVRGRKQTYLIDRPHDVNWLVLK
jgi:hypothetical protein